MKVFINKRILSEEAAAALLKLFPNGGSFSEEHIYRKLREINTNMLPKECNKTPTQIRNEIDKLISEEMTCHIEVEGLTCEKVEKKVAVEDQHEKALKDLKELAKKEEKELKEKKAKKEVKEEKEKDKQVKEEPEVKVEEKPKTTKKTTKRKTTTSKSRKKK